MALISNGYLLIPFVGLAALAWLSRSGREKLRRPWIAIAAFLAIWFCGTVCLSGIRYFFQRQNFLIFVPDALSKVSGTTTVTSRVHLSDDARKSLIKNLEPAQRRKAYLYTFAQGVTGSTLSIGAQTVPMELVYGGEGVSAAKMWSMDTEMLLRALSGGEHSLTLELTLHDGAIGGWQRAPASGREVSPDLSIEGQPYLPTFEIRVIDTQRNTPVFLGY